MFLWQRSVIFLFSWNVGICGFWTSLQASATYNKKKKKSQRGKTKWMKIIRWHSVCDTYCIKWCLACFPYFSEWDFCCSPSLIPQGCLVIRLTNTPSGRQGTFQGNKGDPYPLIFPRGLEIIKEADVLHTDNTPNAHPPCLRWIVCFTSHQKASLKPAFF